MEPWRLSSMLGDMGSVALQAAARHLSCAPGPELVLAVQQLHLDEMSALADRISSASFAPTTAPPPHELWPLINARTSTFTTGGSNRFYARASNATGLNLVAAMDPQFAGTGRFPNGILRTLLYCHGAVIEDPLAMAVEFYVDASIETRSLARSAIEAAVASLVEIESLLDAGVVQTFFTRTPELRSDGLCDDLLATLDSPNSSFTEDEIWNEFEDAFVNGLQPSLREVWRRVRGGDKHPPLDLIHDAVATAEDITVIETFIQVVAELRPRSVVENAVDVIATTAADLARYGGVHDLLCPTGLYAKLTHLGSEVRPVEHLRLNELARVQVPRLDELLTQDAVRIRADSEAFAAWRSTLSRGLERASALREQLGPEANAAQVIEEEIAEARNALFAEAKRSKTLAAGWRGFLGFVAGALAGASGTATGTTPALLLGTAGGLVPPLVDSIARLSNRDDFLKRHYLLFEPRNDNTTPQGLGSPDGL